MTRQDEDAPRMRLYDEGNQRLYINAAERDRFLRAADAAPPQIAAFALTLLHTGCRISEALPLTVGAVQPERRVITFRTLKRRAHHYREVPVPPQLIERLNALIDLGRASPDRLLWPGTGHPLHRATAYRWIKALMRRAAITGRQAC